MMAAAQLDQQSTFDRLFRWYKTYMQHTSSSDPRYGYSSWHCQTSGSSMDDNPARFSPLSKKKHATKFMNAIVCK
jgi:oligosaccharide reducing-end xylanase